jgi:uncharacterized protein YhbP (UPF0306 family)
MYIGYVFSQDRHVIYVFDDDIFNLIHITDQAYTTHHVSLIVLLNHIAAHVNIAAVNGVKTSSDVKPYFCSRAGLTLTS